MKNPIVCDHDKLARQCEICSLQEDVVELRETVAYLAGTLDAVNRTLHRADFKHSEPFKSRILEAVASLDRVKKG